MYIGIYVGIYVYVRIYVYRTIKYLICISTTCFHRPLLLAKSGMFLNPYASKELGTHFKEPYIYLYILSQEPDVHKGAPYTPRRDLYALNLLTITLKRARCPLKRALYTPTRDLYAFYVPKYTLKRA